MMMYYDYGFEGVIYYAALYILVHLLSGMMYGYRMVQGTYNIVIDFELTDDHP